MADITHRTIRTNGIDMHIAEAGSGPLVLMIHGFPELWYSYRHQIPAVADAGFHAVAIDVRGYGGTDAPAPIEAYSMKNMTADAVGVLDALGEQTAVVVGHDWGSPIACNSAVLYPERFRAVIGMSVPYFPRSPAPPTQLFKQAFGDTFFYILYFQDPGVAEAELEADVHRSITGFLYAASGDAPQERTNWIKPQTAKFLDGMPVLETLPAWLTEADIQYFVSEFERTGYRGGLNRYRNMDRDWEELPQLEGAKVQQPAQFIYGDHDGVIAMNPAGPEIMKQNVPNLRSIVKLPGAGHWTQQERPDEVNAAIIEFLKVL
ncbi:MAG: alpha/beta hydrolase [Dehalococcoidia bacterium]